MRLRSFDRKMMAAPRTALRLLCAGYLSSSLRLSHGHLRYRELDAPAKLEFRTRVGPLFFHGRFEVVLVGWTKKRQSLDRAAGC
jgi:hypothetical protein